MKRKSRKPVLRPAPMPPADLDMSPEEYALLKQHIAEFNQRSQRQAEKDQANNARLQRAFEVANERFPGKAEQNYEAFMVEVLKIYNELE